VPSTTDHHKSNKSTVTVCKQYSSLPPFTSEKGLGDYMLAHFRSAEGGLLADAVDSGDKLLVKKFRIPILYCNKDVSTVVWMNYSVRCSRHQLVKCFFTEAVVAVSTAVNLSYGHLSQTKYAESACELC